MSYARIIVAAALLGCVTMYCADAPTTYKSKCQGCHAKDGSGDTAMGKKLKAHDFKSLGVVKATDVELIAIIKKGKNKMPAYAAKLTDDQIKDLVKYIHMLAKPE